MERDGIDTMDEVRRALSQFDRAFASGDADSLAERFAVDGRFLPLYGEPIEGRPAIREHWARLFAEYDPGAWQAEPTIVDVHGDRAYVLSVYSETLVPRRGGASRVVRGRVVFFLSRDAEGSWRVATAMNSHSRRVEELESAGA